MGGGGRGGGVEGGRKGALGLECLLPSLIVEQVDLFMFTREFKSLGFTRGFLFGWIVGSV